MRLKRDTALGTEYGEGFFYDPTADSNADVDLIKFVSWHSNDSSSTNLTHISKNGIRLNIGGSVRVTFAAPAWVVYSTTRDTWYTYLTHVGITPPGWKWTSDEDSSEEAADVSDSSKVITDLMHITEAPDEGTALDLVLKMPVDQVRSVLGTVDWLGRVARRIRIELETL